jgi:hypothetical protein
VITLEDVRNMLAALDPAEVGDWSDETVSSVIAAESAHQRSMLNIPKSRPAELDESLMLRVLHNLATTNGEPLKRVGIQAEGVRELERRWSRRQSREAKAEQDDPKPRGK